MKSLVSGLSCLLALSLTLGACAAAVDPEPSPDPEPVASAGEALSCQGLNQQCEPARSPLVCCAGLKCTFIPSSAGNQYACK